MATAAAPQTDRDLTSIQEARRLAQRAKQAVRFSLGWDNTAEQIDQVLALLPSLLLRIRAA